MPLNDSDLISVVVLSYAPGQYYWRTLESVLMQTYPAIELIVSDDGSDTFEPERVRQYIWAHQRDNIVKVIIRRNQKNMGIPAHDNIAAAIASGKFIKFIADGDAFCEQDSLERLYRFARQHQEWIVTAPCIVSNEEMTVDFYQYPSARRVEILNRQPLDRLYATLIANNMISAVGCIFRKEFFTTSGFDEAYRYLEDWPCWLGTVRNGHRIPCAETPVERYALSGISSAYTTAFESPRLQQDLMLCYEKEIMPHISGVPWIVRYFAQYQYCKLKKQMSAVKKIKFIPFEVYCKGKAWAKKLFFKYKQGSK